MDIASGKKPFDITIAFGEGPIKPVLLEEELTSEQKKEWRQFKNRHNVLEPDFYCLKQRKYLIEIAKIGQRKDLSKKEKDWLKEEKRREWQNSGHFALKQWGIQNALAAGYALYKGKTLKVILSGGKTIPGFAKQSLAAVRLENWPSEAQLMKDVIKTYYGSLYEKKYDSPIDNVLILEDSSTNTLENFAFTINENPEILSPEIKVGFITANHHLKRVTHIAQIFSIFVSREEQKSAQTILKELETEEKFMADFILEKVSYLNDLQTRVLSQNEKRWLLGLSQPQYLTYWLGYLGLVKQPIVIQNAFNLLKNESWIETARIVFERLGLNFDDYKNENLLNLAINNKTKYGILIESLQRLKTPSLRVLPPQY